MTSEIIPVSQHIELRAVEERYAAELHNLAHSPNSAARALISDLDALCRDLVAGEIGADDIVPEAGEGLPLWARGAQMLAERALQHPSAVWSRA